MLACRQVTTLSAARVEELQSVLEEGLRQFDEAQQAMADEPDRARHLLHAAAQRFQSIASAGVVNGKLQYNLGNCYLQADDLGRAILHFRRAQQLIPGDEMLKNNLAVARSRCLTNISPTRRSAFLRSAFFWHYQTSVAGRLGTAVMFYTALWALLTVWSLVRRRGLLIAALGCALVSGCSAVSVGISRWSQRNAPEGVVTAMDVVVYSGPGPGYQRQFEQPLQPGVEFTLRERRGSWYRVELADGNAGWLEAGNAQLIPYT